MDNIVKLHISPEVQVPHPVRFADKFIVPKKITSIFHRHKKALIIPGADKRVGTCLISCDGALIFGGRTPRDTLNTLLLQREISFLEGEFFCLINWPYSEYFHFTVNAIQSILVALKQGFDLRKRKILIFENCPAYVYEYLHLLQECGYPLEYMEIPDDKITQCEDLIFPVPQNLLTRETVELFTEFRNKVLERHPIKTTLPNQIYISRSDAQNGRIIVNEEEVMRELGDSVQLVRLGEFSIIEKIQLFSQVRQVIMSHGAGGGHLAFCSAGTKVVDIMNDNDCIDYFSPTVDSLHSFYFGIVCKTQMHNNIKIDIPLLRHVLDHENNVSHNIPLYEFRYHEHLEVNSEDARIGIEKGKLNLLQSSPALKLHYFIKERIIDADTLLFLFTNFLETKDEFEAENVFCVFLQIAQILHKKGAFEHAIQFYKRGLSLPLHAFDALREKCLEGLLQASSEQGQKETKKYLDQYGASFMAETFQRFANQFSLD